jgi:uncharacterized protein YnzC (UPF0291/DUF896 family)
MKKYERKINHTHSDIGFHSFRCPEKFSLEKINEYAKADNLSFTESELKEIQTFAYTYCEIMYLNWVRNRKQKVITENQNITNEESHFIHKSEYRRAS